MMHVAGKVSRRTLLGAAGLVPAALAAGCTGGGGDGAPEPTGGRDRVRVLTGLGFQSWEAYLYLAEARGWWAEENLSVELLPGEGTTRNLELLAAGQAEVATLDVNAALLEFAAGRHTDFVLTSVIHANLLASVTALESSGIAALRDLEGRSVAAVDGGTNTLLFPALGPVAGFDPAEVDLVILQPPFVPYLGSGQVDASMEFVPNQPLIEANLGQPVIVFPYAEWIPELYGSGIGVSRATAQGDPELARRFNRVALRALDEAVTNPAEAAEVFVEHHPDNDPGVIAAGLEALAPYVRPDPGLALGEFDPTRLVSSVSLLEELGALDAPVEPEQVVDFHMYG